MYISENTSGVTFEKELQEDHVCNYESPSTYVIDAVDINNTTGDVLDEVDINNITGDVLDEVDINNTTGDVIDAVDINNTTGDVLDEVDINNITGDVIDEVDINNITGDATTVEDCDNINNITEDNTILEHDEQIDTMEENVDYVTNNQVHLLSTKKELNIDIDLNLKVNPNVKHEECIESTNEKYIADSSSLNQEDFEMHNVENIIAMELVTNNDNDESTACIVNTTPDHEGTENSSRCISEGMENRYPKEPLSTDRKLSLEKTQNTDRDVSTAKDLINKGECYNVDLSEEESIMLKLEVLQSQQKIFG